jgi:serine/threonine protein kinase
MGRVFLGFSRGGRAVAVKVVHLEISRNPSFRERFRREVAAARAVSGIYTASVVDAGPDDDPPWLATVFMVGPTLAEVVTAQGPLPEEAVWRLAGGLVEALSAVHACGVVHRDLKPANVLLAADGPRLIDFGISQALPDNALTTTGVIVGTPPFMPPEQARGETVGIASDVFTLGSVLAYAATGTPPFGDSSALSVLYRIVHDPPVLGTLAGPLHDLISRCLAKSHDERPSLRELLDKIADGTAAAADASAASFWPGTIRDLIRSPSGTDGQSHPGRPATSAGTSRPAATSTDQNITGWNATHAEPRRADHHGTTCHR